MEFRILGPLEVVLDGRAVALRAAKVRALLGMLLLSPNQVVSADRLADGLWGDDRPESAVNTLQGYMSQLRKALGGDRIQTRSPGYLLAVEKDRIDAVRFERLLDEGHRARAGGDPKHSVTALAQALELWRGDALADFTYAEWAQAEIARLQELHLVATEEWIEGRLDLGHHNELLGDLESLVVAHPLRERLWAARILALYRAGRQAEALRAYQELRERLGEGLGIEPSNALRGLEASVLRQEPSLQWQPPIALSSHLPVPRSTFVGRDQELLELEKLVQEAGVVTVVGPGGVGKTRLVLEVARRLTSRYQDVRLVELAPLSDPSLVLQQLATACGAREEQGRALLESLIAVLRPRQQLLVLDNCEHVLDVAARLADTLLRAVPKLKILATSREPLRIDGERVWRTPSLPVPPAGALSPDAAYGFDAVRLFVARATDVEAGFRLTEDNSIAVAEICRRLDGIPLALELAAARISALTPFQIAARLDDRFRLLRSGSRAALARHQTLSAAVQWSYDLCRPPEQALFRRLSVFAGGFTLEAAEAVCADEALSPADLLDVLSTLVDRSLVTVQYHGNGARYHLLETLRAFAAERLAAAGEETRFKQRDLSYFSDLADRADIGIRRDSPQPNALGQHEWLDLLELEHDNLRTALRQALADKHAVGLATALGRFWELRDHLTEGQMWFTRALDECDIQSDDQRLKALNSLGVLFVASGDYSEAQELFEGALDAATQAGDDRVIADSLSNLARLAGSRADLALALQLNQRALAKCRTLGDAYGTGRCLGSLGWIAGHQCNFVRARALQGQSLSIRRQVGDEQGFAWSIASLGRVAMAEGEYDEAAYLLAESMTLCRLLNDEPTLLVALAHSGELERARGNLDRAGSLLSESIAIARNAGRHHGTLWASVHLAAVLADQGQHEEAQRIVGEAMSLATALENKLAVAEGFEVIARTAVARGEHRQAGRLLGAATAVRDAIGAPVPPYRRAALAQTLDLIRHCLGDAASIDAAEEGRRVARQSIEFADLAGLVAQTRAARPTDRNLPA